MNNKTILSNRHINHALTEQAHGIVKKKVAKAMTKSLVSESKGRYTKNSNEELVNESVRSLSYGIIEGFNPRNKQELNEVAAFAVKLAIRILRPLIMRYGVKILTRLGSKILTKIGVSSIQELLSQFKVGSIAELGEKILNGGGNIINGIKDYAKDYASSSINNIGDFGNKAKGFLASKMGF